MAMCIHGWQFETCKFGCTLRKKEELKIANDELQAENEKLKPKPLLFDRIGSFKVIINDSVPEGEIWFATDKQLQTALEFSAKQVDRALKEAKGEKP